MLWVAVDAVVVVLALAALTLAGLALWRRVRALGRAARSAVDELGEVTRAVEDLSQARRQPPVPAAGAYEPSPAGHPLSIALRHESPSGA